MKGEREGGLLGGTEAGEGARPALLGLKSACAQQSGLEALVHLLALALDPHPPAAVGDDHEGDSEGDVENEALAGK